MIDIILSTAFTNDLKKYTYTCQITMDASSFGDFLKLIICLFLSLLGVKKSLPREQWSGLEKLLLAG